MADKTGIEWTDATWNPTLGCSLVSPGCTNCYAMTMAARIEAMGTAPHYAGLTKPTKAGPVWTGTMRLAPEATLTLPLRWRRGRRIFVNSMSDLFHEDVPDAWIDRVFAVMALSPQHTYQILTKRSARMRAYLGDPATPARIYDIVCDLSLEQAANVILLARPEHAAHVPPGRHVVLGLWPLPNVWLGVSAEDQRRADERIPDLLATPAAIRFVSAEPLLGPINFRLPAPVQVHHHPDNVASEALSALVRAASAKLRGPTLDQIIVGGESGKGARPMHPDWARSIRDQCAAAGTAFFFKQWGEWGEETAYTGSAPAGSLQKYMIASSSDRKQVGRRVWHAGHGPDRSATVLSRIGKRAAGRLLDGVEHNAMPEVRR